MKRELRNLLYGKKPHVYRVIYEVDEGRQAVLVLTVRGKAAAIVQDAEAYQRLLDIAAQADVEEGIRQGLDDVAHGRTRPAREVFDEIRRKHDIPR